ncbi:MAG: hypothetical protein QMD36_03950 [Candidatus Aenigmarchaeota archaeon]|nr:hypothetical protein [Candidatus Aenigmarchaeota archaeon]
MVNRKCLFIAIFLTFSMTGIYAQSIGVSPPFLDLGEIQPGESKIATFYLVTVSENVSLVQLIKTKSNIDFLMKDEYKDKLSNYSEEDILPWIEFINNPVELKKTEGTLKTRTVTKIRGAKEVNFIVNVPRDAEPGYHMGMITFDPLAPESGRMFTIKAIVPLIFIFKVPGKAIREGRILEVSSGSYYNNGLILDIFFQNTGTVSMMASPADIKIFDSKKNLIGTALSNFIYTKPGELKHLTAFWDMKDVEFGKYNVTVKIHYTTGYASKESTIEVYEKPEILPAKVVEKEIIFSWWVFVILVIIILAYVYYKR